MKDSADAAGDLQQLLASKDLTEAFISAGLLAIDVVGVKFGASQIAADGKLLCKQFDGKIQITMKKLKIAPRDGVRKGKSLGSYKGHDVYENADVKNRRLACTECRDLVPDGGGALSTAGELGLKDIIKQASGWSPGKAGDNFG